MQNEKCSNKTLRICGPGGVRKNKGKWQAVVTVADEMTGKKVQRTKNTGVPCLKQSTRGKAAAMRFLSEFRSEIEFELAEAEEARAAVGTGLPAEQRDDYAALPLSEALEKFIDFCLEMNRITPTTRDDYHYSALHIERDELGLVPVNEVTTDDVNAWSRRRIALGTAPDTLNKSFKLGKRLYAVLLKRSNDTIGRNPFDGALAPRVIARPRNALRSDLVPKLNSVTSMMSDSPFRRAVVLALHTGMRIGEVCGLRWCDVDFESGLITVRHSVAYVKDRGSFIKDTKNHDLRTIPIDPVGLLLPEGDPRYRFAEAPGGVDPRPARPRGRLRRVAAGRLLRHHQLHPQGVQDVLGDQRPHGHQRRADHVPRPSSHLRDAVDPPRRRHQGATVDPRAQGRHGHAQRLRRHRAHLQNP